MKSVNKYILFVNIYKHVFKKHLSYVDKKKIPTAYTIFRLIASVVKYLPIVTRPSLYWV